LYFNGERSLDVIAGARDFEPDCRDYVEHNMSRSEIAAIDAILRAFPVPPEVKPLVARAKSRSSSRPNGSKTRATKTPPL
jgi:hypothetical protein